MRKPFTLWLTGLSGAGKSTLANAIAPCLRGRGDRVEILDGDAIRENLSTGLGFSKADRDTNVRRIGFVADLLSRNGVIAIVAAISPYRDARDGVRRLVTSHGAGFVEVAVTCPIEVLERRDPKGLYRRALSGQLANFTGVSDPYEPPLAPELALDTAQTPVEDCVRRLLARLDELGH